VKPPVLLMLVAILACTAQAAEISLVGVDGKKHRPLVDEGQASTVLFFVLHDCPVANGFAPEMNRIAEAYGKQRVRAYLVYVEPDITPEVAQKHAREYGYRFPALMDPQHELVRVAGATATPETAVFSAKGELLYRGRIDDRVAKAGGHPGTPGRRDLRDALDAILAGKPVRERFTKAIGCYIPERAETATPPAASSQR
jgi:hypothetical protein